MDLFNGTHDIVPFLLHYFAIGFQTCYFGKINFNKDRVMTTNIEAWNKIIKGLMPDMDISVTEAGGNLIVRSEEDLSALQSIL